MKHLFILGLAFIVILGASLGSFLFISLVPFFHPIGIATTSVMMVGLACIAVLLIAFTYNRVGIWAAHRRREALLARVIVAGDIVVFPTIDGSIVHLSAMHEAAKVPLPQPIIQALPAPQPAEIDDDTERETILTLHQKGLSLRNIEKVSGIKYHRVQSVVADYKQSEGD